VAGAQALATAGAEVTKIKIVARHSGDAILRYVSEAPLTSLRHELGRAASSKGGAAESKAVKKLMGQLKLLTARVELQDASIIALQAYTRDRRVITYVQNLHTRAIHAMRAGDSSSSICGWKVGSARVKRGKVRFLNTILGEDWKVLCPDCLRPEREAAKSLEQTSIDLLKPSAEKQLLES